MQKGTHLFVCPAQLTGGFSTELRPLAALTLSYPAASLAIWNNRPSPLEYGVASASWVMLHTLPEP